MVKSTNTANKLESSITACTDNNWRYLTKTFFQTIHLKQVLVRAYLAFWADCRAIIR